MHTTFRVSLLQARFFGTHEEFKWFVSRKTHFVTYTADFVLSRQPQELRKNCPALYEACLSHSTSLFLGKSNRFFADIQRDRFVTSWSISSKSCTTHLMALLQERSSKNGVNLRTLKGASLQWMTSRQRSRPRHWKLRARARPYRPRRSSWEFSLPRSLTWPSSICPGSQWWDKRI